MKEQGGELLEQLHNLRTIVAMVMKFGKRYLFVEQMPFFKEDLIEL